MWKGVIVTGASKGFGRAVALSFAKYVSSPLFFVLVGRDLNGLHSTQQLILDARIGLESNFSLVQCDLSKVECLDTISQQIFKNFDSCGDIFEDVTLINNAGSLGPLAAVGDNSVLHGELIDAINLNITSFMILTNEFVKWFRSRTSTTTGYLVNISSLAAIQPFESWSIYCGAKAARDMFLLTLSKEELSRSSSRKLRILNYAPGPLDTAMQREIREGPNVEETVKSVFQKMKENNQLIDAQSSADKLVKLLKEDSFGNGTHVDYFDV